MPYTPPSQHSPSGSQATTPAPSHSQSFLKNQPTASEGQYTSGRPALPRSTGSSSYLSRHRRSPSWSKSPDTPQTPEGDSSRSDGETNQVAFMVNGNIDPNGSLRQSPPPANNLLIPTGATISPPESAHNSSDDEDIYRRRGRELENLEELQEAIKAIEQRREGSPNRTKDEILKARLALEGVLPLASDNHPDVPPNSADSSRPPLSREARKISHSRSSTESNIKIDGTQSLNTSPKYTHETDDEDDSDNTRSRPQMVRKKSGELVRPALRPPSAKRRPSSMPGTPTYSKVVHFDSHLEHVRHFLQVDRPLAVSAGSSPVEAYESEVEFPFGSDEDKRTRGTPYEWEIRLANFPPDTETRKDMPVSVERVYLSSDKKNLVGSIAVQNLAYHKLVVARFTFDYWKTTSEVVAEYNNDVRRRQQPDGRDRFTFTIKLADQANLENKTLFFCVRYTVHGQDYWDNNGSINYQVDFSKKVKPQNGKSEAQGLGARPINSLPRSRPSSPASAGRPKSMPTSFDDFATGFDTFGTYVPPPSALMGESPIKLKGAGPRAGLVLDTPTRRHKPGAQAFGNRYDFGAALSAAIQNASGIFGESSGASLKPDAKQSSHEVPAVKKDTAKPGPVSGALAKGFLASKPAALVSEKPPLQSQSYQELVDKYCFFGSGKSSPPELTSAALKTLDGVYDDTPTSDLSVGSGHSSGSTTPTPHDGSPSLPNEPPAKASFNQARASSPLPRAGTGLEIRPRSPTFSYPYRQSSPSTLLMEQPPATAIQG